MTLSIHNRSLLLDAEIRASLKSVVEDYIDMIDNAEPTDCYSYDGIKSLYKAQKGMAKIDGFYVIYDEAFNMVYIGSSYKIDSRLYEHTILARSAVMRHLTEQGHDITKFHYLRVPSLIGATIEPILIQYYLLKKDSLVNKSANKDADYVRLLDL